MPKRIYSSAGDGYFESFDYGESWNSPRAGLEHHHYLAGLAVDSGDPQNVVVSASHSAWQAHSIESAESLAYRMCSEGENGNNQEWKPITNDLPEPSGTIISVLTANPNVAGEFYAINNRGIFCSTDSGNSWKMLDGIAWPKQYLSQHPRALVVREN